MRIFTSAALVALNLTASCAPNAGVDSLAHVPSVHQGLYDNTGHGGNEGGADTGWRIG